MDYTHARNHGARVCDRYFHDDLRVVVMENELLRISILADQGTDVFEFLYKPRDVDFMWRSFRGIVSPSKYAPSVTTDNQFPDYYEGGWQEIFPLGSRGTTYMDAAIGFHGEVWGLPWQHEILEDTPEQVSVKFWVRTIRTPFLLEKTLTLKSGLATLFIDEAVTNEGRGPLEFMWGHHPAFSKPFVDETFRMDAPAREVMIDGDMMPWPEARGVNHSLVKVEQRDEERMKYLHALDDGWYALTNPTHKLSFAMRWDKDVFPYVWIWQEFNYTPGYPWFGRTYATALEPFSSLPGAFEEGTRLLKLDGGQQLATSLLASVHEGLTAVSNVRDDGVCEG